MMRIKGKPDTDVLRVGRITQNDTPHSFYLPGKPQEVLCAWRLSSGEQKDSSLYSYKL